MNITSKTPTRLVLSSDTWCELLAAELERRYRPTDPQEDAVQIIKAIAQRVGWPPNATVSADGWVSSTVADLERAEDDPGDSALAAQLRRRP